MSRPLEGGFRSVWLLVAAILGGWCGRSDAQSASLALTNDVPLVFGNSPIFTESIISVPQHFALTNLALGITAVGPRVSMQILLIAPDGTEVPVHFNNHSGLAPGSNIDCRFRTGNLAVLDLSTSGNHDPTGAVFDSADVRPLTDGFPFLLNRDAGGDWKLRVSSTNAAAGNIFARWALFVDGVAGPVVIPRIPVVYLPATVPQAGVILRQIGAAGAATDVHARIFPFSPAAVFDQPSVSGSASPLVIDSTNLLWTGTVPLSGDVALSWRPTPVNLSANAVWSTVALLDHASLILTQRVVATSTRLGSAAFANDDLLVTDRPGWLLPDVTCGATNALEFQVGEDFVTIRWEQDIEDPGFGELASAINDGSVTWENGGRIAFASAGTTGFGGLFPELDVLATSEPHAPIGPTSFTTLDLEVPEYFPVQRLEVGLNISAEGPRDMIQAVLESPSGQLIHILTPPVVWQDLETPRTTDAAGRASHTDAGAGPRFYRAVEQ